MAVGGGDAAVTPDNAAAADVTDTASTDNAAAVAATAITPDTEGEAVGEGDAIIEGGGSSRC